jgi:hypothetical protein
MKRRDSGRPWMSKRREGISGPSTQKSGFTFLIPFSQQNDRSASQLVLQCWLGSLPCRRSGPRFLLRSDTRCAGKALRAIETSTTSKSDQAALAPRRQERRKSHPTKVTVGLSSRKKGKKPRQKELFVAVPSGKQWASQPSRFLILPFGHHFACIGWQLQHRRV